MADSTHFFKIVLQTSLRDRKLKLPNKFVRNYGKFLSNPVRIKLPNGDEWRVGLTTVDGNVWLQNGWREFAEYYSLEFGSLLVFRYDSISTLQTLIFDLTGLEIDYSCNNSHGHQKSKVDDSIEILDSYPQHPKKREKTSLQSPQPCKKMRDSYPTMPKCEPESMKDQSFEVKTRERTSVRIKPEVPNVMNVKVEFPSSRNGKAGISVCEKLKDLHWTELSSPPCKSASKFSFIKPSFVISMLQSHVQKRSLNLPNGFAKKYLIDSNLTYRDVILETSNGKKWAAKLYSTGTISQPKVELCYGWRVFVLDNGLKEGDVCVFELSKLGNKFILNIAIFRLFEDQNCRIILQESRRISQRASSSKGLDVPESSNKSVPRDPFFEIDLRFKLHMHQILSIPASFCRKHLSPNTQIAKLQVRDKKWEVKLLYYCGSFRLSAGWGAFYNENSLEDGDRCVFELMSKKNCAFKVTIIRGKDSETE